VEKFIQLRCIKWIINDGKKSSKMFQIQVFFLLSIYPRIMKK